MSEALAVEQPVFDPYAPYSIDNYPPNSEQYGFFRYALLESYGLATVTRERQGPIFDGFKALLEDIDERLYELHPALTPEYLMPMCYQSEKVRRDLRDAPDEIYRGLNELRRLRFEQTDVLVDGFLSEYLKPQEIVTGRLDVPPYCRQGDGWKDGRASMTCANACFRMVFGGIAGWTPSEEVVAKSFIEQQGTPIVHDSDYHKIFDTNIFTEICDKEVSAIEVVGADFAVIDRVASITRKHSSDAQVYCVASLSSATATRDIWHASVILEATESHVICHDPSGVNGRPYKMIPKDEFIYRWAGALNRVQIFIAR